MLDTLKLNREEIRKFNDPFVKWLIAVVSTMYVLLQIPPIQQALKELPFSRWLQYPPNMIADALQVIAMVLLIIPCSIVQPKPARREDAQRKLALAASNQFRELWVWLIGTWLLFYLALFLRQIQGIEGSNSRLWDTGIDTLNNLQGVFLFLCYWVLTSITVTEGGQERRRYPWPLLIVSVVLFFAVDISVYSTEHNRIIFRLLSGLWVGVCMGLLIGCLESEYLNVVGKKYLLSRRFIICSLYLYAVLQLSYVGFRFGPSLRPDLEFVQNFGSILSLPLKLLFITFCYWLLRDGRLEFYMEKTREAIENADSEWQTFTESGAPAAE